MAEQQRPQRCSGPVQNSEVYVLRHEAPPFPTIPPPSPPSPITPAEDEDYGAPPDALRLSQPAAMAAACGKKLAAESRLARAVHVLSTESAALHHITQLYSADRAARDGFDRAVEAIVRRQANGGKLVVVGVGKSGHIAKKLVATFNSLAIQAVFLHPTEALHGDLGLINTNRDALLLITFSGKTPELLALLPHLDPSLPMILLTGHGPTHISSPSLPSTTSSSLDQQRQPRQNSKNPPPAPCDPEPKCEILLRRPENTILLPALVHEPETVSFGVAAPTTSTTVALAVGDALALVSARELYPGHGQSGADVQSPGGVAEVFKRNHPGGAIGAVLRGGSLRAGTDGGRGGGGGGGGGGRCVCAETGTGTAGRMRRMETETETEKHRERAVRSLAVHTQDMAALAGESGSDPTAADVLRAGYASASGWVRLPPHPPSSSHPRSEPRFLSHSHPRHPLDGVPSVIPPRRIRRLRTADFCLPVSSPDLRWLVAPRQTFVPVAAGTSIAKAAEWIRGLRAATAARPESLSASATAEREGEEEDISGPYGDEAVVAVIDGGECVGLLEVGRLLEKDEEEKRGKGGVLAGRLG
ncbi:hypothetical protein VTK26DRAFT_7691 [Humicola hyalothermophila]